MNEIQELQAFRAELDEPPPAALARARAKALRRIPAGHGVPARGGRVWPRRLALPAVATLVVAIVVGVTTVADRGTAPRPGPSVTSPGPVPSLPPTTAEAIEWLARRAEAGPAAAQVGANQLIQVKTRFLSQGNRTEDSYRIDPYGLIEIGQEEKWDKAKFREFIAQQHAQRANRPGNVRNPTPQWLATLDPNPQHLRQLFQADLGCTSTSCAPRDVDWGVWMYVSRIARDADVIVPPQVRAGLIRLLGGVPGLTVHEVTVDNHIYWAIRKIDSAMVPEDLYVDPVTGRVSGQVYSIQPEPFPTPAPTLNIYLWQTELITI